MEFLEQCLRRRQVQFWYEEGFLTMEATLKTVSWLQGFVDCYNKIYETYKIDYVVADKVIRCVEVQI